MQALRFGRVLILPICLGLALTPLSGCDSRPDDGGHMDMTIKPEVAKTQSDAYKDYQKNSRKKR